MREVRDDQLLELALVENLQREDLDPIEAAMAFRTLTDEMGLTQQQVGERVGKDRASIANLVRLLQLPAAVQDRIKSGEVPVAHAKVLLGLGSHELQGRLAARVAREGMTVRALEGLVKRLGAGTTGPSRTRAQDVPARDVHIVAAEEELQRALGTKVSIVASGEGGRIELHYFSDEELQRLHQIVLRGARTPGRFSGLPTEMSADS